MKQLDDARDLLAVGDEVEERFVLADVTAIEIVLPPVSSGQKNTGSRYAPNSLSSAARISNNVQ